MPEDTEQWTQEAPFVLMESTTMTNPETGEVVDAILVSGYEVDPRTAGSPVYMDVTFNIAGHPETYRIFGTHVPGVEEVTVDSVEELTK